MLEKAPAAMKLIACSLSLLLFLVPAFAKPSFEELIANIAEEAENADFDPRAAAEKLAESATVEELASLVIHPSPEVRICAVWVLTKKKDKSVMLFLGTRHPAVKTAVAKAILDEPAFSSGIPQLAKSLEFAPWDDEFLKLALIANDRMGDDAALIRVLKFVTFFRTPGKLKAQGFRILLKREQIPDESAVELSARVENLLRYGKHEDPERWLALSLQAAQKFGRPIENTSLVNLFRNPTSTDAMKIALAKNLISLIETTRWLNLMADIEPEKSEAFYQILYEHDSEECLDFCRLVFSLRGKFQPLREDEQEATKRLQSVLRFLLGLENSPSDALLSGFLTDLTQDGARGMPFWLEMEQAIEKRGEAFSEEAKEAFLTMQKTQRGTGFPEDKFLSLLEGGNANRGMDLIFNREANCLKCHSFANDQISEAPRLDFFEDSSSRKILRSLIAPSHDLVDGYGESTFTLQSGEKVTGVVSSVADGETFIVVKENGTLQEIPANEVLSREQTSPMPSALESLGRGEIRDIVAYLTRNE